MKSVFEVYHAFFLDGDKDKLMQNLTECGSDVTGLVGVYKWTPSEASAIRVIAAYINTYGYECVGSNPYVKGDMYTALRTAPPFLRLTLGKTTVEEIKNALISGDNFNNIKYVTGESCSYFDGEFVLSDVQESKFDEYLTAAIQTYLYGMPISDYSIITDIKNKYITSGNMMEAVMYLIIGTELCNKICNDASDFNMTIEDWCVCFDNTWFDVSHQISDGFITMYNPIKPGKVTCVSTLYQGKYFTTVMNVFQFLYENDFLGTVRFVNKSVPVMSMVNGKPGDVTNRVVEVPVYYEEDEENLVSDIFDENYIYNELFICDVGRI